MAMELTLVGRTDVVMREGLAAIGALKDHATEGKV
jgi:hypothetical protein